MDSLETINSMKNNETMWDKNMSN